MRVRTHTHTHTHTRTNARARLPLPFSKISQHTFEQLLHARMCSYSDHANMAEFREVGPGLSSATDFLFVFGEVTFLSLSLNFPFC